MTLDNTTSGVPSEFVYRPIKRTSCTRRMWLVLTWLTTFWIPSPILSLFGMKRRDVQLAFREKLTICWLIFLACAGTLFVIIGLPAIICPKQDVMGIYELETYNKLEKAYVSAYGRIFDVTKLADDHVNGVIGVEKFRMQGILGTDVSQMFFPALNWEQSCPNIPQTDTANWDNLVERVPETYWPHYARDSETGQVVDYMARIRKRYMKGKLVWPMDVVEKSTNDPLRRLIVMYDNVYNIAAYSTASPQFFDENMGKIFSNLAGKDATKVMQQLMEQNPEYYKSVLNCMNNLFYIGSVDRRMEPQCVVSNWILVSMSIVMAAVMVVKFLGAMVGSRSVANPDQVLKGTLIQVPCYTEGTDELAATFDSITKSDYDEQYKVMIVTCDGQVTGDNNDKTTPELVLDILYQSNPPNSEWFEFESIPNGKRNKSYINRARIYSGVYNIKGHMLPFIVIVKEHNAGKRDSQLLLMRFLQRLYANEPMTPLEIELYWHLSKVNPTLKPKDYEFLTMIDADTTVDPDALTKLVTAMSSDRSVIGATGQTLIANPRESFITMLQVYDYFISQQLHKKFESALGSVTCLPGCYSMYRIRSQTGNGRGYKPLLVAPKIVKDYSATDVDTLHKKNLLTLGEDRYLTTLLLKHCPSFKTIYVDNSHCYTQVPVYWSVFLSQRRRWINSTLHNLMELLSVSHLAGCGLVSLRFVVLLEMLTTIIMPASIVYLYYLCVMLIMQTETLQLLSIFMLGGIYALQLLLILISLEWQNVLYMILYVLCQFPFPLLSVVLPLYSFYNMDSFSWGATRVVMGDNGKVVEENLEEDVDYSVIPRKLAGDDPRISVSPLSLPTLREPSPLHLGTGVFTNGHYQQSQYQQPQYNQYGHYPQPGTPNFVPQRQYTPQPPNLYSAPQNSQWR